MSLTYNIPIEVSSMGDKFRSVATVDLDNSYPTGGYVVEPGRLGLFNITQLNATANQDGYAFEYNLNTGKLLVYDCGGGGINVTVTAASAGTPAGSVSAPTFTGAALSGHDHDILQCLVDEEVVTVSTNVGELDGYPALPTMVYASAGGVTGAKTIVPSSVAPGTGQVKFENVTISSVARLTFNAGDTVSAAIVSYVNYAGLTQSVSAGTPHGTNSAPNFTGSAMSTHTHSASASGSSTFAEVANGTNLSALVGVQIVAFG